MQGPNLSSRRSFLGSILAGSAGVVALIGGRGRVASAAPRALPQAAASQATDPAPARDPAASCAARRILPMSSVSPVLPGTAREVTARPSCAIDIERIFICAGADPVDWIVNDIKIGGESTTLMAGDLPGELFANDPRVDPSGLFDNMRTLVQAHVDFAMTVTYIGPIKDGAVFTCAVIGRTASRGDRRAAGSRAARGSAPVAALS